MQEKFIAGWYLYFSRRCFFLLRTKKETVPDLHIDEYFGEKDLSVLLLIPSTVARADTLLKI